MRAWALDKVQLGIEKVNAINFKLKTERSTSLGNFSAQFFEHLVQP